MAYSKLSSLMDELCNEMTKTAMTNNDKNLSTENRSPNISSNIGKTLLKVAQALRSSDSEITHEELNSVVGK